MSRRCRMGGVAFLAAIGLLFAALAAPDAFARRGSGCGHGMMAYDPATEITLRGTVEEIVTTRGCCMDQGGTHVSVRAGDEVREVALGPTDYLATQKMTLAKGDALEITGSNVTCCCGSRLVLARTLTLGGRSLTLRDADGTPAWSRGR